MLNRLTNVFKEAGEPRRDGRAWEVDRNPAQRLGWLLLAMAVPLAAVAGRLVHLQYVLAEQFAAGFGGTTESFEPIPTRDGRILASDGRVLACDVERFGVLVHYRWLQNPPDPGWLRQQALSRLARTDRRDRNRIEAEEQHVLQLREATWARLSELSGWTPQHLEAQRARIQERVERIIASVERRRESADRSQPGDSEADESARSAAGWWRAVREALTTPPERPAREPLVVREELEYHRLLEGISLQAAAEIEAHPELYPGLRIHTVTERSYPNGSLAAHVVGARTPVSDDLLADRQQRFPQGDPLDYRPGDRIGTMGVERTYDRRLRGLRGLRKLVRDRNGEVVHTEVVRAPRLGRDVVLALHLPLQERMEALLDNVLAARVDRSDRSAGACLIALDVRTGAVLAAATAPRFDLSALAEADAEGWSAILDDPRRPLFHRAVQMAVAPGSVFKTLTAVALLESGRIDPDARMFCQGFLSRPDRHRCYTFTHYGVGHAETDLSDALCESCNVYFFRAAQTMGPEPIVQWAERFGFGHPTGIDLPDERGGSLPRPPSIVPEDFAEGSVRRSSGTRPAWYPGDTLGLAIGQSRLAVTPLQIARMMAAVANGGLLVQPYVVRGGGPTWTADEEPAPIRAPQPRSVPGLSGGTLGRVREGLERVVSHPRGTGYKTVRLKEVTVAGKTGTAEVAGRQDHAWFAGYVPADQPKVAFVVILEHAGAGGREAGPVAQKLVRTLLDLEIIRPADAPPGNSVAAD